MRQILAMCIMLVLSSCVNKASQNKRATYYNNLNDIDKEQYDKFVLENGATVADSGLTYYYVKRSSNKETISVANKKVTLHYRDKILTDEEWHDSSFARNKPESVSDFSSFHPSWQQAISIAKEGDRIVFLQSPSDEKYIREKAKNRLLVFEIEILEIIDNNL